MGKSKLERRASPRIPGASLDGVLASLVGGPEITLVNISRGGALVNVPTRYAMRAFVRLKLTRPGGEVTIAAGTVLWSKVGAIVNGQIHYVMAITFEKPLDVAAATGYVGEVGPGVQEPRAAVDVAIATAAELNARSALGSGSADASSRTDGGIEAQAKPRIEALSRPDAQLRPTPPPWAPTGTETSDVLARVSAIEAQLEAEQRLRGAMLAEQKDKYEAMLAQLVLAASEQQAEHRRVLDEARVLSEQHTLLSAEMASATARTADLEKTIDALERVQADALAAQHANHAKRVAELLTGLSQVQAERQRLLDDRERSNDEHMHAVAELQKRCGEYENDLARRELEFARSRDEQKAQYESVLAELVRTANDQQAEFQQLLADRTAACERERGRADGHEVELERMRQETEAERFAFQQRSRELEQQVLALAAEMRALEALCAAHDARTDAIRREAQRLAALAASPVRSEEPESQNPSQAVA